MNDPFVGQSAEAKDQLRSSQAQLGGLSGRPLRKILSKCLRCTRAGFAILDLSSCKIEWAKLIVAVVFTVGRFMYSSDRLARSQRPHLLGPQLLGCCGSNDRYPKEETVDEIHCRV